MRRIMLLIAVFGLFLPSSLAIARSAPTPASPSVTKPIYEVGGDKSAQFSSFPSVSLAEGIYKAVLACENPEAMAYFRSDLTEFSGIIRTGISAFRVPRDTPDATPVVMGCNGDWKLQLFDPAGNPDAKLHTIEAMFVINGRENFSISPNGQGCAGAGAFIDMFGGLPVYLLDDRSAIVGESMLDSMDRVGDSICIYFAAVFDVPEIDAYQLSLSDFDSPVYTLAEMQAMNWKIEMTLS